MRLFRIVIAGLVMAACRDVSGLGDHLLLVGFWGDPMTFLVADSAQARLDCTCWGVATRLPRNIDSRGAFVLEAGVTGVPISCPYIGRASGQPGEGAQ
jgi:hypothetical protein